jgi:hypothetical protein
VVAAGVLVLIHLSRGEAETVPEMILNILSWAASAYMAVVIFFVALPLGLVPSLLVMGLSVFGVKIAKNDEGFSQKLGKLVDKTVIAGSSIASVGQPVSLDFAALLVPREEKQRVLQLLRERPLLPVSLTRFEDANVLFIRKAREMSSQILRLLQDVGLGGVEELSPFHTRALLSLPLIERREEVDSPDAYVFCHDETAVNRLVEIWPNGVTLYPSRAGPIVVAANRILPGFETEPIPRRLRSAVVLERNVDLLDMGGTEIAAEHAA